MTADQTHPDIELAPDGVQEVRLTRARPLLSRLIRDAQERGVVTALTQRKERRIVLVTPAFYEEALRLMGKQSGD